MPSRSPSLATVYNLCFLIIAYIFLLPPALGQEAKDPISPGRRPVQPHSPHASSNANETGSNLLCTVFGSCEPCPPAALHEQVCQPFGNRRLMHCVNVTSSSQADSNPTHSSPLHPAGEILAWESCGRIVSKERADFYEFVAVNVIFALIALGVLFFRSRRMQMMQARQLAVRIGLFREEGRPGRI